MNRKRCRLPWAVGLVLLAGCARAPQDAAAPLTAPEDPAPPPAAPAAADPIVGEWEGKHPTEGQCLLIIAPDNTYVRLGALEERGQWVKIGEVYTFETGLSPTGEFSGPAPGLVLKSQLILKDGRLLPSDEQGKPLATDKWVYTRGQEAKPNKAGSSPASGPSPSG